MALKCDEANFKGDKENKEPSTSTSSQQSKAKGLRWNTKTSRWKIIQAPKPRPKQESAAGTQGLPVDASGQYGERDETMVKIKEWATKVTATRNTKPHCQPGELEKTKEQRTYECTANIHREMKEKDRFRFPFLIFGSYI